MTTIHPTAIVHPRAELSEGVDVGPYSIIGEHVTVSAGTKIGPHVQLDGYTTIGRDSLISAGAVIGTPPQDDKYRGEPSKVIIGDRTKIREYVAIHSATGEGAATCIGDNSFLMALSHVGHNCKVGNDVMMASYSGLSGHVVVEDRAVIGGFVGVHQYVRIGKLAMVSGYSRVVQDVPPFSLVDGRPARVMGLNVVGLRRAEIPSGRRQKLQQAFRTLYRSYLNFSQALDQLAVEMDHSEEVRYLVEFFKQTRAGRRGPMPGNRSRRWAEGDEEPINLLSDEP